MEIIYELRRDNSISGPQGISWSGFSVKKIIKEIFFKISGKKIFYYFSLLEISNFFRENLVHGGCVC